MLITVATTAPPRSTPRAAGIAREQREQRVAVHGLAALVHHHAAVGVAVERDPDVGAQLAHLRRRALRVAASRTPSLMLRPFGSTPIANTSAPSSRSTVGPDLVGGAVRAVEHDAQAVERQLAREASS